MPTGLRSCTSAQLKGENTLYLLNSQLRRQCIIVIGRWQGRSDGLKALECCQICQMFVQQFVLYNAIIVAFLETLSSFRAPCHPSVQARGK